jgi:hypothetical protein
MVALVSVSKTPSSDPKYKMIATFSDEKRVKFGGKGCMDFTLYHARNGPEIAEDKRRAYIARHRVREDWTNPQSRGALSRFVLWEYPSVEESVARYEASLDAYIKNPTRAESARRSRMKKNHGRGQ